MRSFGIIKKITFTVFLTILVISFGFSQTKMQWFEWEEGYQKAKDENKILLVEVVSDNCKFCLKMDKVTFVDKKVADQINMNYIPVKINSDRTEKTFMVDGKEYDMNQMLGFLTKNSTMGEKPKMVFPTVIFLYPDDDTMFIETGYQDPSVFKFMLSNCVKEKAKRDKKNKS